MSNKLPILKSKSVIITGLISIGSLVYKAVDAAGNAEFLWQKLGLSTPVAQFLGSPRAIDFMVAVSLLALVLSLLYQFNRGMALGVAQPLVTRDETKEAETEKTKTEETQAEEAQEEERIVVDVTPNYLMSLFDEHTGIQANKLAEAYVGKWMKVSGTLSDIRDLAGSGILAAVWWPPTTSPVVFAVFVKRREIERVSVLRRGDEVTILGQIESLKGLGVRLENCELISSKAKESLEQDKD